MSGICYCTRYNNLVKKNPWVTASRGLETLISTCRNRRPVKMIRHKSNGYVDARQPVELRYLITKSQPHFIQKSTLPRQISKPRKKLFGPVRNSKMVFILFSIAPI